MFEHYARFAAGGRTPSTGTLEQANDITPGKWRITDARDAVELHETGDFSSSSQLADAMGRDLRIGAVLNTRANAVVARNGDVELKEPDGGDSIAKRMAKRADEWFWDVVTDTWIENTARTMVTMGVSLSRVRWERDGRTYRPAELTQWHSHNVGYDASRGQYYARTVDDTLHIEPGDPNWLLLTPGGARSWMCGAIRALGVAYVFRAFDANAWARYNERHGTPILAFSEPSSGRGDANTGRAGFYQQVRKMGSSGVLRLPQMNKDEGYDAKYLEPQSRSWESFRAFKESLDTDIAICVLGQNLSTEVSGGSYAAAAAQEHVRGDYRAADIEILSTALRTQLLTPWAMRGEGGFRPDRVPWPTWDTSERVDKTAVSTTFVSFANAVSTLSQYRDEAPVDFEAIAKKLEIPLLDPAARRKLEAQLEERREAEKEREVEAPVDEVAEGKAQARLRSGDMVAIDSGFVEGQLYADELTDRTKIHAAQALQPYLRDVLDIIDEHDDYEAIRQAVIARYRDADDSVRHAEVIQLALAMSRLAGRTAARQDV